MTNCSIAIIVDALFLVIVGVAVISAKIPFLILALYRVASSFRLQEYVNRLKDKSRRKADILSTELRSAIRSDVDLIKLIIRMFVEELFGSPTTFRGSATGEFYSSFMQLTSIYTVIWEIAVNNFQIAFVSGRIE